MASRLLELFQGHNERISEARRIVCDAVLVTNLLDMRPCLSELVSGQSRVTMMFNVEVEPPVEPIQPPGVRNV